MEKMTYFKEMVDNFTPIKGFDKNIYGLVYRIGDNYTVAYLVDGLPHNVEYEGISTIRLIDNMDKHIISKKCPQMLFADGFDDALIGIKYTENNKMVALYDHEICVDVLMRDMSREDAIEYMDYNVLGSYVGEYTPAFLMERIDE